MSEESKQSDKEPPREGPGVFSILLIVLVAALGVIALLMADKSGSREAPESELIGKGGYASIKIYA